MRFSPYLLPHRTGRSASPPHGPSLAETQADDEDEEEVDFWGGSSPRDQAMKDGSDGDDEEEDEDEDEDMEEDIEDDADDAEVIDIFGHR